MALSTAERQQRYREKRKDGKNNENRLNCFISSDAFGALKRLSRRNGISDKAMLENLLLQAEKKVLKNLDVDSKEFDEYYQ